MDGETAPTAAPQTPRPRKLGTNRTIVHAVFAVRTAECLFIDGALIFYFGCRVAGSTGVRAEFRAGTADEAFKALDGALQLFLRCGVAARANTGFAHSYSNRRLADGPLPVLGWCENAPVYWIARVPSAFVAVVAHRGREVTPPVHVVAFVIGARVVVVAHDAFAEVLSADAFHADAGKAIEGAIGSVVRRGTRALRSAPPTITTAKLPSAIVAVVRAHDARTRPGLNEWAAPNRRHHAKRQHENQSE